MGKRGLLLFRVAGLVGVAALAAGCADSSPQADRRPPTTTGPTVRPPSAPTSTSTSTTQPSTTNPAGTSSTSSTAVEAGAVDTSLPVVSCPTSFAVTTATVPLPSSVVVDVPPALARTMVVYSDTHTVLMLLAPKGWTCKASFGADGSGDMTIVPAGETLPTGALARDSSDQAITAAETGASPVIAALQACAIFPAAAHATETYLGKACPSPPVSQRVDQISPSAVAFEDPAGTAGTGSPSGGENPANGVVTYSAAGDDGPGSYIGTCTLPSDEHDACTASLNYFLAVYGEG
jgi:hypothetical protein